MNLAKGKAITKCKNSENGVQNKSEVLTAIEIEHLPN